MESNGDIYCSYGYIVLCENGRFTFRMFCLINNKKIGKAFHVRVYRSLVITVLIVVKKGQDRIL